MAMTSEIPSDIVLLTSPQLFGMMFNWGLWGVLSVQVYIYYLFFKDSIRVRILVYSLYLLECIQIGLSSADIFYWFAKGWGQLSYLADPHFAPIDMPMVAGVIAMVVQLYFTWRIWILGSCLPLCIVIALVSIGQGIAGFVSGIQALQRGDLTKLSSLVTPKIWLAGAALSDTLIAISMCFFLYRARKHSRVPRTKYILRRIIALTIETNSLTASIAILTLILFVRFSNNTLYLCPPYALGKLYTNTLLVIFNNRIRLPKNSSDDDSAGLKVVASVHTPPRTSNHSSSDAPPRQGDQVVVTVLRESDAPSEVDVEAQSNSGTVTAASNIHPAVRRQTPPSADDVSERISMEILKPEGIAF
ncbi:hypothetical protein HYPSUDRAFT_40221 [Hypholoma sublateritium FD-334 SS-4]|uniref:DUF6534 domain-containing protein n=1 Tax=Hypholoma sublateritium (strain FD-334 SS-4) TaxID=945553 RepID=A0A0D2L7J6_HYPSF|nr:hypothetical protein HYPSUDRAFT_40221 [Hypholoma sublateritium FD-334 SS-4]